MKRKKGAGEEGQNRHLYTIGKSKCKLDKHLENCSFVCRNVGLRLVPVAEVKLMSPGEVSAVKVSETEGEAKAKAYV